MNATRITDAAFLALSNEQKNVLLDEANRKGDLFTVLANELAQLPWNPEDLRWQNLWTGLSALVLFKTRIEFTFLRPHLRVFLDLLHQYKQEATPVPDEQETPEEAWQALGLDLELLDNPEQRVVKLLELLIHQGGNLDWQHGLGFLQGLHRLHRILPKDIERKLYTVPATMVLSSKPNRGAIDLWKDVWNRTTYHSSDLFYHDSRLRRALLDKNMDHAYRLVAVLGKAGKKATDLVAGIICAGYDLDFQDDQNALSMLIGTSFLLESFPRTDAENFRRGLARLLWDLAYEPKKTPERIFYDEISLIKSREIILDFRKAMLRSDFLQTWGYAEYAFVHGFDALHLFDEIVRLSPSFYEGKPFLLFAWNHLAAIETLLRILPEDYGIYIMAHTVRILSRTAKDVSLLDPFPDENL